MTPTRSSRRYQVLKGRTLPTGRQYRPTIPMVPAANQAVNGYPFPNQGPPLMYDLVRLNSGDPDRGTTTTLP
jgi:hypothetical protein